MSDWLANCLVCQGIARLPGGSTKIRPNFILTHACKHCMLDVDSVMLHPWACSILNIQ